MAQRVRVYLVDDLINDGTTEAAETVRFSLDGQDYEIDLTAENAHVLRSQLKEFTQAARVIRTTKRGTRYTSPPAGVGKATTNRHQDGDDTAAISAWAVEKGLRKPGQRGRNSSAIKQAYSASKNGNDGPLNDLLKKLRDEPVPNPAEQGDHSAAHATGASAEAQQAEPADPKEVEALQHYEPLTVHSKIAGDLSASEAWANRTASGQRVADLSLVDRIELLTGLNLKVLGGFMLGTRNKDGNISHLATCARRLENLEMVRYSPNTGDGWEITEFGRYAYEMRSLGE